jgi:dTDP-4-dehydrorhamnose 3,5-epimerase
MPELIPTEVIEAVVLVRPDARGDERGLETYRRCWFRDRLDMIQGNRTEKQAGAVVGLHFHPHQADFWYALRGRVRVVLHDLRVGSLTAQSLSGHLWRTTSWR